MRGSTFVSIASLLLACEGPTPMADAGAPAIARFALPTDDAPLDFAAVPFPSDLYLDADGHPRVGRLPVRTDAAPRWVAMRELLAGRGGFCATCNTYFGIDGALDPESVPESATPESVASIDDAIVMADVDPSSPERGRLIPLRVELAPDRIAVRPVRGVVLRRGRRYAVASAPVRANLDAPGGPVTAAAFLFDPGAHGMLEILEQPSTHEPPLVPPLVARPSPIVVTNPIGEVHAQIEHFVRTRIETGRSEIR